VAQQRVIDKCFAAVVRHDPRACSFIERVVDEELGEGTKLVFRTYATLFFILAADDTESELGLLDLIQVLVEALDKRFENVCELDIVFNATTVHFILDELIVGGLVAETNQNQVLKAVRDMEDYTKATEWSLKNSRASSTLR
jgi:AP-3 complex subunit sigma